MPRGDKKAYSNKQKRQAKKIEEGYEERGTPVKEAKRRAWATVNKMWGGGQRATGVEKPANLQPAKKGGKLGGQAAAKRPAAQRSASARKAAATRQRRHSSSKK